MPENPRIYSSKNPPSTPKQGDIQYNEATNAIECYTGTAWGTVTFSTVTAGTTTVGALTATSIVPLAGFPSLNTTGPGWYIPAGAGPLTGAIPSLALRVPIAYNTVGRQFMVQVGGTWFGTASLSVV